MIKESVYGTNAGGEVQNEDSELERGRLAQETVDDWASAMEKSPESTVGLMVQLQNTINDARSAHNEGYVTALAIELLQRVNTLAVPDNVKNAARDYLGEFIQEHKLPGS
jgi:hypothetical protein